MIVTLTLNPSLDRTVDVPHLARGEVIRATSGHLDPGGKGVNVARALRANGCPAHAVLPVGGPAGHHLVELLEAEGTPHTAVPVAAVTRSNLTLSEPDGTVTKVNESGGPLTGDEVDRLADALVRLAEPGTTVVLSGSLPPGAEPGVYAHVTGRLTAVGVAVAVDTSGPALTAALAARPALVKPNRDELAEALGWQLRTLSDARKAAEALRDAGAGAVLASLGADGALLVDGGGTTFGSSPVTAPRSTVGAGDCLLAGYVAATSAGLAGPEALATALRWAAAAVELPGSRVPTPSDVAGRDAHVTTTPDLDRPLGPPG